MPMVCTAKKSANLPLRRLRKGLFDAFAGGISLFLLLLPSLLGCRQEESESDPPVSPSVSKSDVQTPNAFPKSPVVDGEEPEPTSLDADEIFRDVIDAYQHDLLKYYSDKGYVELRCEEDGAQTVRRYPMSITFQKPNYVRMEVGNGVLVCDGENLWGKILEPIYGNQILKAKAPYLFSAVKEFYPDIILAHAMDLNISSSIFWAPPQLILLFAKQPLTTLLGNGERYHPAVGETPRRLLAPCYLKFNEDDPNSKKMACDRIAVRSAEGNRVFWVNRETKGIVRIDLPIEQIPVPEGVDRVLELSMNFPQQVISNEVQPQEGAQKGIFSFSESGDLNEEPSGEKVEHFTLPELKYYGKRPPIINLKPLLSGDSPVSTEDDPDGIVHAVAFWGGVGDPVVWERSQTLLREMAQTAMRFNDSDKIEFLAVNVDSPNVSDADIRSIYGDTGIRFPLYRMGISDLAFPPISQLAKPSLVLIDGKGLVQMIYYRPVSYVTLQLQISLLLREKNLYQSAFSDFERSTKEFEKFLSIADENDYYATKKSGLSDSFKLAFPKQPQKLQLKKAWEENLREPSNPLVIADPLPEGADSSEVPLFSGAVEVANESILVPYGGNMFALLSTEGKTLQSKTTGAGEPVSFIRAIRMKDGKRFFAVSSHYDTHRIYIFGDSLQRLMELDVNEPQHQWVADLLLNDQNGDNNPELIMALIGDAASNMIPRHGIYLLTLDDKMNAEDDYPVHWKDEFIVAPFRLGFVYASVPGDTPRRTLLAMNVPADNIGKLIEDDLSNGQRLRTIQIPDDVSVLWFTSTDKVVDPSAPSKAVAALIVHPGEDVPSFALITSEGEVTEETPIQNATWGEHLERIVAGDFDGDGAAEWIVPTREGVIYFFDEEGKLYDQFAVGREVTGVAVANWEKGNFLIVAHTMGVIAYQIEGERESAE